ncbi:MAG TPA: WD40 repeat domain-containing protein [Gemmataceae bacterium]|nr:WD40 repeat domain-containing protein [Gemmataceae bacterium]
MKLPFTSLMLVAALPVIAEPGPPPRVVRLDLDGDILPDGAIARLGSTRFQECSARKVTLSQDATQAVCIDEDSVRVWDLKTGRIVHAWSLPGEAGSPVGFGSHDRLPYHFIGTVSDDGRTAVRVQRSPEQDQFKLLRDPGTVAVRDVPTGKRLLGLALPNVSTFSAVALSPDDKTVATADYTLSFRVRVWDVVTGAHRVIGGHNEQVDQLLFLDEGRKVMAFVRGSEWAVVYHVAKGEEAYQIKLPGRSLVHPARGGKFFLVYEAPNDNTLYDAATGKPVPDRKYPDGKVYTHPRLIMDDGSAMLCYRGNHTAVWDFKTGGESVKLPVHGGWATALSADGKTIILAGAGLWVFDRANGKELAGPDTARTWAGDPGVFGWSMDGTTIGVPGPGSYGAGGYVYDADTGRFRRRIGPNESLSAWYQPGHYAVSHDFLFRGGAPREMAFTFPVGRNGQRVSGRATPSAGDRLLALRTVKALAFKPGVLYGNTPVDIPPRLCSDVAVHERFTGVELYKLAIPVAGDVAFSSDHRRLTVLEPERLRVFDAATGDELLSRKVTRRDPLPPGQAFSTSPAFSPDSTRLAVNHRDGTILVWDVSVRGAVKPLTADELPKLWNELASSDARAGWRAVHRLLDGLERSVPFLLERVKPAAAPAADTAKRLLAELDSPEYRVREAAMKKVLDLGDAARPFVEESLKTATGAERRRRLEALRELLPDKFPPRGDDLRRLRALVVLEQARTKEVRAKLDEMVKGLPKARVTLEASETLGRVAARDQAMGR